MQQYSLNRFTLGSSRSRECSGRSIASDSRLASRRDVESILVRQVGKEIDRALPWQAGHGRRTAAISLLIGQAVGLIAGELHDLKLAAFLHDIGLLMLPHDLTIGGLARSRLLRHRAESSSAWRLATRAVLLSSRGYHPHSPSSRTMGRIGLSVWHQRTIHPPWSQDPLDRRRLRCHSHPRSLEPSQSETRSRSELSKLQPAPNLTRS